MINVDRLRGLIAEKSTSQSRIAKAIGISQDTFYKKMKKGRFDSNEIEQMILLLSIDDPVSVFFTQVGAPDAPRPAAGGQETCAGGAA